ncbi:MAG: hypothetical protein HYR75_03305, partial [Gemmatimonadetes bacterium]|nr:hypothetical protein [Gemmatimonadota bacterium]
GGMGGMGGGMRGMGGRRGGMERGGGREQTIKFPPAKDLEKFNPAALLLDKHKKISLADSQTAPLRAIQQRIYERNAPMLARYDSTQKLYKAPDMRGDGSAFGRSPRGGMSVQPRDTSENRGADSTRTAAFQQMRFLRTLLDSLQERRRTDVREVLEFFTDEKQQKKAAELLDDQDMAFNDALPQFPQASRGRRDGGEGRPPTR